ncbi:MAG: aldehyde ferredoxin oxidoreductase family protein [Thermodesulfobacteriota bacterium]
MTPLHQQTIASISYEKPDLVHGYANQTLKVDLTAASFEIKPVTREMKETFTGGKGFDLWLLWNAVTGKTVWSDPENAVCISSGPMGGTPIYPGSGKSIVTTISPLTGSVMDSNVGGYFGPYLKFSGFDALEIVGKAAGNTVLYIDGESGNIQLLHMNDLPQESYGLSEALTEHFGGADRKKISVVSAGPGARNTYFGCLNFSYYDGRRKQTRNKQAGRGGIGTVFEDKGLKGLVVKCTSFSVDSNNPADKDALKTCAKAHTRNILELDPKQNEMAKGGTTFITMIMNDHDLLPTHNFRYGQHPQAKNLAADVFRRLFDPGFDGCWYGCSVACAHGVKNFVPTTGPYKGQQVFVDGPEYETIAGVGSNLGIFDPYTVLEINFYCDAYGIDTISFGTATAFAMDCYDSGLIGKEQTGGLDLSFGNRWSALEVLHQMASGQGFGPTIGRGVRWMKELFSREYGADAALMQDIGMESKGLEFSEYISKESLAQQGGYGLALKGPQHDEAWLIFLDQVHNLMPSFEQKAENLHWFPMIRTWFGLCGLCKLPWNDVVPADNSETEEPAKVMGHMKLYAQYFSSVTGRQVDPDDLVVMSEKVYNFQRIFNLKMGFGRREQDRIPYRAVGPVTALEYESRQKRYDQELIEKHGLDVSKMGTGEKIAALREKREEQYEQLTDAVYERRGWTFDGIPTLATVRRLGIDFPEVVDLLAAHGVRE